jgi:RNA polymerase sigma factor (sigma-70 family)
LDVQVRRTYLARASDEEIQRAEAAVQEIADQLGALDGFPWPNSTPHLARSTKRVPFLIEREYHYCEWRSLMDDVQLLREYAARSSEAAFEQIVDRHINLVYSTALRQVRDPQLAQEVTQVAFILLARKARWIRKGTILSGWLFKTARFAAMRALRSELRRQHYEHTATQLASANDEAENESIWVQMAPLLDEAISGLGERDRQAVLLRFFENKSLKEVGEALGSTEEASKKRVARALEKLRTFFNRRGVTVPAVTIAAALTANSVQAAPMGLAASVTSIAAVKGATAAVTTLALVKGTMKMMFWSKIKFAVPVAAALMLALTLPRLWSQQPPGALDPTFKPTVNYGIRFLLGQPDGKILVAAVFSDFVANGLAVEERTAIIRLNGDGSRDPTFTQLKTYQADVMSLQPDGRIIVGGSLIQTNTIRRANVFRLNSDGTMDTTFNAGVGTELDNRLPQAISVRFSSVAVQEDGKIMLTGTFREFAGVKQSGLVRLNRDGSLDRLRVADIERDDVERGLHGARDLRAAPVTCQRRVEHVAQPVQDDRLARL